MRWNRGSRSSNIEDRRGMRLGGGMGLGLGGTVVLLLLGLVFGKDFLSMAGGGVDTPAPAADGAPYVGTPEEENQMYFLSEVLDDAQATWSRVFAEAGQQYRPATLVVFQDVTNTACGVGQSASGPFYCPPDEKVYLDLGFFQELSRRFGAPGDFAQAYVVAHEIGHHVQHLQGIDQQVRAAQQRGNANELSVRMELQADCYAGLWGHRTAGRVTLEAGDIEEGLNAAAAIGDDRLQRMSGSAVTPEGFTHGSSAQRMEWLRRGLESGRIESCDTFR